MTKKTWITPKEAFEIFGRTFLDGFDVFKLYLHRLPAKAAKVSGSHFCTISVLLWNNTGKQKLLLIQDM